MADTEATETPQYDETAAEVPTEAGAVTEDAAGGEEVDEELETMKQRLKEMEDETNKLMNGGDDAGAAEAAVDRKSACALHKMPRRLRCLLWAST